MCDQPENEELQAIQDQVDLLPNAMIMYEINGRGVASSKTLKRRQCQLAQLILDEQTNGSKTFTPPLKIQGDLIECRKLSLSIESEIEKCHVSVNKVDQWLSTLEFLSKRLQRLKEIEAASDGGNSAEGADALPLVNPESSEVMLNIMEMIDKVAALFYRISNTSYSYEPLNPTTENLFEKPTEPTSAINSNMIPCNRRSTVNTAPDRIGSISKNGKQSRPPTDAFVRHSNDEQFRNYQPVNENADLSTDFINALSRLRFDSIIDPNVSAIPANHQDTNNAHKDQPPNPFRRSMSIPIDQCPNRGNNINNNDRQALDFFPQRPKVPIYKWKIKFTGNAGSLSATEFIQQINEFIVSRNSSHHEVFLAAPELFEGDGLKWLRTQSDCRNWQELMQQLVSDFESPDFVEDLLDYIKRRKQEKKERVVIFIAQMENMFIKLGTSKPTEAERCRIIQKNLIPEFAKHLSLLRFDRISNLKDACKDLEASYQRAEKYDQKSVRFSEINRSSRYDDHYSKSNNDHNSWQRNRSPSFERRDGYNNNYRNYRSPARDDYPNWRAKQTDNNRNRSPYRHYNSGYDRNNRNDSPSPYDDNDNNNSDRFKRSYSPSYRRNDNSTRDAQSPRRHSNDRDSETRRPRNENSGNDTLATRQGFSVSQSPNRGPNRT